MAYSANKVILIIDAYASGNLLAPQFQKRGFECVHVQSTKEIYPALKNTFVEKDFVANLAFLGDLDALLRNVKKLNVEAALAGTDSGVHLADSISEALGLKSNGTELSKARRNKFLMIQALQNANVDVARLCTASDVSDLIAWKKREQLNKVVVKPIEGCGDEDAYICESDDDIVLAHNAIVGKTNMLGLVNDAVVMQEFLEGCKYLINAVSLKGQHVINDIIDDKAQVCDTHSAEAKEMISYTKRALDALGIKFGPSQSSVMVTKAGPRLIEMSVRLENIDDNAVDMTVDSYVDETKFYDKARDFGS